LKLIKKYSRRVAHKYISIKYKKKFFFYKFIFKMFFCLFFWLFFYSYKKIKKDTLCCIDCYLCVGV